MSVIRLRSRDAGRLASLSEHVLDTWRTYTCLLYTSQGNMEMTIAQQPYKMGYDSVMCGVGALKGETYERQIPVDVEIIDASNCKEYKE